MSDLRGRRRISRPVRIAVLTTAAALLGAVMFAGVAQADDRDGAGVGGITDALTNRDDRAEPARSRSEQQPAEQRTEPAPAEPARTEAARTEQQPAAQPARTQSERAPSERTQSERIQPERAEPANRPADDKKSEDKKDKKKQNPGDEDLPADIVRGTPCTNSAVACVSLGAQKAWLFKDGKIAYGPVTVSTGGPKKQTPVGDHVVQWKHQDHKSAEFKLPNGQPAPMNFAVFFAEGGVAFHEGSLNRRSAGCVRMVKKDAQHFFTVLQLGDKVEVRG